MNEASLKIRNANSKGAISSVELILTETLARADGLWLDPSLDWEVGRF